MKHVFASTLLVAVVATLGDWIWATFLPRHLMVAGLVHGGLLCMAMGAALALPGGRVPLGAAAGLGVGVIAAGVFYALAAVLRMGAMLPAWVALWVMLGLLTRPLGADARTWRESAFRGVAAGVASGVAFYLVSGMWTRWDPAAINYLDHFARWAFAFVPGFVALQAPARRPL